MPQNIEIKARLHDRPSVEARAESIADSGPTLLRQVDHFYRVPQGRLKLREINGEHAELIFYHREDSPGPKSSDYLRVPVQHPAALGDLLEAALQPLGTVRKARTLYLVGQTRIHLDEVEDLGSYLELEVVLQDGQSTAEGEAIAHDLLRQLAIRPEDLVPGAYVDHLAK